MSFFEKPHCKYCGYELTSLEESLTALSFHCPKCNHLLTSDDISYY